MARTVSRAGGHRIDPTPAETGDAKAPARPSDPANPASHPTSRKPNAPAAGGVPGSHGGGPK
jgi:hypothetical protein